MATLAGTATLESREIVHAFPRVGRKRLQLDGRKVDYQGAGAPLLLVVIREMPPGGS